MQLYSSPATPFGRKAAIVAREHGIALDIVNVNPFDSGALERLNPVKLVPVLVLDDGTALYDSAVICAWLDEAGGGPTLHPAAGKWDWQRRMALGQALAETSVAWILQKRLPEAERSATLMARYDARWRRIAARLEAEAGALAGAPFRMDHVTAICGLGHLEFRHAVDWRATCPALAAWYDAMLERPSVAATRPVD